MWQRPHYLPALGVVAVLVVLGALVVALGNRRSDLASYEPDSASHSTGGTPVAAFDPAIAPLERSQATTTFLATIELAGGIAVPHQRLSVLGPEGQLLDTIRTDSAGRLTFDVAQGCTEVQVRADFLPSLRTQPLRLPPQSDEREIDLGAIAFGGSGVVIRAHGVEVFAGDPVTCGLRLLRPVNGLPEYLSAPLSTLEGAQAYFELPPALDLLAFASCGSFTERSAPFSSTRSWQLVVQDFNEVCRVDVQLRDIPGLAAEGRVVRLEPLGESRRQDGAAAFRYEEVGAGGKLMLLGRFDARQRTTVALEIDFGPPLVLDHQPSGAWLDCSSRFLVPVDPVIAIGIVDARGELVLDRPFSIQIDIGGVVTPFHDGLHLLRERDLEGASLLRATLAGAGVVEAPRDSLLPLGEGIYGLAVSSGASSGSLRVMAEGVVHAELQMRVRAPSGELVAVVRPETAAEETSWTVQSLRPGMYDLFWSWGEGELCQREWASEVEVLAGQPTSLHASPPVVADLPGSFVAWDSVPFELRPIGLSMEGRYARVGPDGTFRLRVAIPFRDGSAAAEVAGRIPLLTNAVDLTLVPDGRSLVAEFRLQSVEVVGLGLPGECERSDVRVEIWTRESGENAPCVSARGSTVLPLGRDSNLSIPRQRGELLVGAIWEWDAAAGGRQDLLGFFEVPCGIASATIACDGRALELRNRSEHWTVLALEWTGSSGLIVHCPIGRIEAGQTITVWSPHAASALVLTDPSGRARRVAIENRAGVVW